MLELLTQHLNRSHLASDLHRHTIIGDMPQTLANFINTLAKEANSKVSLDIINRAKFNLEHRIEELKLERENLLFKYYQSMGYFR